MKKERIEITEEILGNSKLGTTILAVISLQNEKGYAKYNGIFSKVFPKDNSTNNAKLSYYLDMLKDGFKIPPADAGNKEKNRYVTDIIKSEGAGIYKYNKEELIRLFIEALGFLSLDYNRHKDILCSEEVRTSIYNYLINYSCFDHDWENHDLLAVSDIISNIEAHLLVKYYNKQLEKLPKLKKWAEIIIKPEEKNNLFIRKDKTG